MASQSSSTDVHYEVFQKANRKASWRLVEARDDKTGALELAAALLKKSPASSIRVTKEKWVAADGAFRSYTVFEAGDKYQEDDRADRNTDIPCRTPADLINPAAREAIGGALTDWLSRNRATPLELLHRVDLVEKLEASGAEFQHAIQKVAIARASADSSNVQNIIKQLNDLVKRAIEQLYAQHRNDAFPEFEAGEFTSVVTAATDEGAQRLRGAIAQHLKELDDWPGKLGALLALAEEARSVEEPKKTFALDALGDFIVDVLEIESAQMALLEADCDTGDTLDALTDIILARPAARATEIGKRLAEAFKSDDFRSAQCVIARRILTGLTSPKRLKPGDIRAEIDFNRSIADRLITVAGRLVDQRALVEGFVYRSGRLLSDDAVESLIDRAGGHAQAIAALVELEDNIVGDANKSKLAGLIRARLVHMPVENHYLRGLGKPTSRLAELAALRRDVDSTRFADQDKAEIGEIVDRYAVAIENDAKLFDQVVRRCPSPLDAAATLLRLVERGVIPEGRLGEEARERARSLFVSEQAQAAVISGDPACRDLAKEISRQLSKNEDAAA